MVHPIQLGRNQRMSYAKIDEVLEMPNLIEVQKNSYNWFLEEGLKEVLRDISPITDYTGNLILEFIDYKLETNRIKYSVEECKERDTNYAAPLKAKVRLINKETGEVKEQEIFMGICFFMRFCLIVFFYPLHRIGEINCPILFCQFRYDTFCFQISLCSRVKCQRSGR